MIASLAITNTGSANTSTGDVSIKSSPKFSHSDHNQDDMNSSSFELNSHELDNSDELDNNHELNNRDEQNKNAQAPESKDKYSNNDTDQHDNSHPLNANNQSQQKTDTTDSKGSQTQTAQGVNTQATKTTFNDLQDGTRLTQAQLLTQTNDVKALHTLNASHGPQEATAVNLTPQQALTANLLQQGKPNQNSHSSTTKSPDVTLNQMINPALATSSLASDSEFNLSHLKGSHLRQTNGFMPAGAFAFNADNIENALSQLGQGGNNVVDEAAQLISQHGRTQAKASQWGPISVPQSAPLAQQAQTLLSPLKEQLRFQVDQQIKHAEVRLDPPELGKIELNIRLDGDKLHIQMNAANTSVRDALQLSIDRLRDDLAMDHGGQIDVDISQGEQQEQSDNPTQMASIANAFGESVDPLHPPQQHLAQNQVDLLA
ncbi:flagellar hook-length control protein FliK [uncultured Shewanella sp.]|uniref:flagellar hook-length control protein FliK n=1 Tax=uncultured Shewanella sp. TaxID=173975 RepID=UPI002622F30E|nr:flagellar hook-length control protein FliK [uncultured Shewanella sp.]